ncbi:hypothetical protein DYB37_007720 [Aphanomyces astaci]|uniref:TsaA-like domain-containing protein n=2 Tax=Aphanomyces astaci TaxID=112090 RepID=A0A3R6ZG53_APHAT|nr:hypothetical protein DYB35_008464 [Aphanomyces astaci]RHZ13990.1 hypothetical protein DYB37_007720 [Aphanomyces astaci]
MNSALVVAVAASAAACSAALVWYNLRASATKLAKDDLKALAKIEREGRVRLQIALGAAQDRIKLLEASSSSTSLDTIPLVTFPTIGVISSPYSTRNGTPRQPSLVDSSLAKLVLHKNIPHTTLVSLAEFSHAWVLFHFHQNTNVHKNKIKGTIKPPRLNGQSVGVLATRSPHRPAPLGLSLAKIVEVNVAKGYVLFQGLDLVHATPVVDIKPYVAFSDAPTHQFAPAWVGKEHAEADEPLKISQVVFASPEAQDSLRNAHNVCKSTRRRKTAIELYADFDQFTAFVKENLSLDMRSTRERADPKFDTYRVTLCDVMVHYKVVNTDGDGPEIHIVRGEVLTDEWQQPLNETTEVPDEETTEVDENTE